MTPLRPRLGTLLTAPPCSSAGIVVPSRPPRPPPRVGGCYDYTVKTVGKVSSAAPVIGCESAHTAETFYVGTRHRCVRPAVEVEAGHAAVRRPALHRQRP